MTKIQDMRYYSLLLLMILSGCSGYKDVDVSYEPCRNYQESNIIKTITLKNESSYSNYFYYFGIDKLYLITIKPEDILSTDFDQVGFLAAATGQLLENIKLDFPLDRNEDLNKYVISSEGMITTFDVDSIVAGLLEAGKVRIWSNLSNSFIGGYDVIDSAELIAREFCVDDGLPILLVWDGIE